MNHHAPLRQEVSPVRMETRAAFIRLAKSERRLSWEARRNALEAKASGDDFNFHYYRARAVKLWRDALDHLEHARRWSH